MNHIDVKKLGLAFGATGAILYLGCILLMATVGHTGTVKFFNSLLHGLDVSSVIRMDVPVWEAALGIAQTFILGWLIGACIAAVYNAASSQRTT
ncbi:DUF5676 family membrane protein [Pontibacter sp. E15-1]|uniref:DUF5676 family membrane protein n=1 Tax=Pontibacter sp. E15-1 TaxID=2919918 RepID=UPI001F4F45AB|nr:DUF5676 family membrane protein [Pontibacter sp. E15-1]MCJ8163381.1 DUF5676 family membrane protein [Pontibacter sp. E15-1]